MPTENRSSNTEQPQIEAASAAMAQIRTMLGREQRPDQVAAALESCDWSDSPIGNKAIVLSAIQVLRATQPHAEPIAWMVGTAFWWTKEEAERDAAETGLPIVGLGPMSDRAAIELAESETMAKMAELAECETMADMVAEREWAEHVGTGDVSSKVEAAFTQLHNDLHEVGALRDQLRVQDALLEEAYQHDIGTTLKRKIRAQRAALSASAEPSASAPMPAYMEAACDKFDWTPEEALSFYAEGKHFDTDNGRTRILCTGAIASHALKGMGGEYAEMKGAEPSSPVERDERAAYDAWRHSESGYVRHFDRHEWAAWQARAALDRKQ